MHMVDREDSPAAHAGRRLVLRPQDRTGGEQDRRGDRCEGNLGTTYEPRDAGASPAVRGGQGRRSLCGRTFDRIYGPGGATILSI